MKIFIYIFFLSTWFLFLMSSTSFGENIYYAVPSDFSATYKITRLTSDTLKGSGAMINENGYVVWEGIKTGIEDNGEIYLYDGVTNIPLTDNDYDDKDPIMNENGFVAWLGQINEPSTYSSGYQPFLYDGATTIQLSNSYDANLVLMNNNGDVVWNGCTEPMCDEVFLYNGSATIQLTDNFDYENELQLIDNGHVAWLGYDGTDYEVFIYDGSTTIQHTDNDYDARGLKMNNNGGAIWREWDTMKSMRFLYLYDGSTVTQLTDNLYFDINEYYMNPQINNYNQVVWYGSDGSDNEVFYTMVKLSLS